MEQKESGAYNGKNSENSGIENGKDNSKKRKEWHWPDSVWADRNHPSVTAFAAGILFIVFSRLQQHIIYAYWLFVLLSALTAILIINRPGNPAFKLAWMVPITFFPVFGMLLYLFVEFQAGTVWLNHRLQNVEQQMRKYVLQDPDVFEELEKTDKRLPIYPDM